MGKEYSRLSLALIIFGFLCQANHALGIPIRYYGSLDSSIILDAAKYDPARDNAYPWEERIFSSSPSIWSNRINLRIEGGSSGGTLYFVAPLRLRFAGYDYPGGNKRTFRLYNEKWDSTMLFKAGGDRFKATLSQSPNFIPKGLLGNFRATNRTSFWTGQPDLGLKIEGKPSSRLNLLLNAFQTEGNDYVSYTETIPLEARQLATGASGLGPKVGSFTGAREGRASYIVGAIEGTRLLQSSDRWGLYLGRKYVANPGFAINENDQGAQRVQKYDGDNAALAFSKDALEFNWQGRLKQGKLILAGSTSAANWQLYRKTNDELTTVLNLGRIGGNALGINLEDESIGPLSVSANFYVVDPDYQWVLAKDPKQAYAYFGRGQNQDVDTDFSYMDTAEASKQLSDVSHYLGRRFQNLILSASGSVGDKPALLTTKALSTSWLDPKRRVAEWDQELDLFSRDDYNQFSTNLLIVCSRKDLLSFQGVNRQYDTEMTSWLRGLTVTWQHRLSSQIAWNTKLDLRSRFLSDQGQGEGSGFRLTSGMDGRTNKGTLLGVAVDMRQGNYDFGLLERGYDAVFQVPYDYRQLELYAKLDSKISVGSMACNLTLGGQFWKQKSSLPAVIDGSSLIGYSKLSIPWAGSRFSQEISLIAAKGPDDPSLPTGYVTPALDNSFRFQLGGSGNSSLTVRTTYYPDAAMAVTSGQYQIGLPRGSFVISYGYWDNSDPNWGRYARYEVAEFMKKENPLTGKRWEDWNYWWVAHRVKEGYRNQAYPNYFMLYYSFNF